MSQDYLPVKRPDGKKSEVWNIVKGYFLSYKELRQNICSHENSMEWTAPCITDENVIYIFLCMARNISKLTLGRVKASTSIEAANAEYREKYHV